MYQYNAAASQWKPIVADSSEWFYDTASAKLYLRRALNNQDSFYYSGTRKFMFADTRFYKTSSGGVFNLDEGNSDRFIFKTTASRFPRPVGNLNSANIYSVYEIDNDTIAQSHPFEAAYYGLGTDATVIPSATQKIGIIGGVRAFTTFAGADSLSVAYGLQNLVTLKGKGYTEVTYGINNTVSIRDSSTFIGQVTGMQNSIAYSSPLGTPRVIGNLYGYFGSMSTGLNGKVDGNAFGIFLTNVSAAGVGSVRNWGIFTNKGPIRFGDSVLVTEGSAQRPRAVFDVNSTTAMITPAGSTAQRPVTGINGMIRYNSDLGTPEAFTSSGWVGLKNPQVATSTVLLDPPNIFPNSFGTVTATVTGASVGNVVIINPSGAMTGNIAIAYARVSAANTIEVNFVNTSNTLTIDMAAMNFYVRVLQ